MKTGVDSSSLRWLGKNNYEWAHSAVKLNSATSGNAYNMAFYEPEVVQTFPSDEPHNRWLGFPVRCLVY